MSEKICPLLSIGKDVPVICCCEKCAWHTGQWCVLEDISLSISNLENLSI